MPSWTPDKKAIPHGLSPGPSEEGAFVKGHLNFPYVHVAETAHPCRKDVLTRKDSPKAVAWEEDGLSL